MKRLSKSEIRRFDDAIKHIREAIIDQEHDPRSALYCNGITFTDEVLRFNAYAEEIGAHDVVDALAFENAY